MANDSNKPDLQRRKLLGAGGAAMLVPGAAGAQIFTMEDALRALEESNEAARSGFSKLEEEKRKRLGSNAPVSKQADTPYSIGQAVEVEIQPRLSADGVTVSNRLNDAYKPAGMQLEQSFVPSGGITPGGISRAEKEQQKKMLAGLEAGERAKVIASTILWVRFMHKGKGFVEEKLSQLGEVAPEMANLQYKWKTKTEKTGYQVATAEGGLRDFLKSNVYTQAGNVLANSLSDPEINQVMDRIKAAGQSAAPAR